MDNMSNVISDRVRVFFNYIFLHFAVIAGLFFTPFNNLAYSLILDFIIIIGSIGVLHVIYKGQKINVFLNIHAFILGIIIVPLTIYVHYKVFF